MKTAIYYFSGTGNSYAAAKTLANNLDNGTLLPMGSSTPPPDMVKYDRLGFVYPNYYGHMPRPVKNFVSGLTFNSCSYCFGVATGGGTIGLALHDLEQELNSLGGKLHYSAGLLYGGNYIVAPYYRFLLLKGEKLNACLKKNGTLLTRIAQDISLGKNNETFKQTWGAFSPKLLYGKRLKENRLILDKDFSSSADCTGCGLCARLCPVDNIDLDQNNHPRWKGQCEDCCGCLQVCPNKAILFKGKVLNKDRYWHPEISVKEMIANKTQ